MIIAAASLTSCSRPPDIEEIRGRISELIDASYEINTILFGEGPKTYERVYDPKASMKYHEDGEGNRYYYFYIEDEEVGKILAYRTKSYGDEYSYLLVSEDETLGASEKCVYSDTENGLYYIQTEYAEKESEFYYDSSLPADYDVVRFDEKFLTVDQIKEEAEKVYSADYLASIYETLFTGIMISDDVESGLLTARYIEYEDRSGEMWFMKSNTYEPLMKANEKRIFDVSSAQIARGSNAKRVRVEMESYLESAPDKKETVIVNLAIQDGIWYLDSGTY